MTKRVRNDSSTISSTDENFLNNKPLKVRRIFHPTKKALESATKIPTSQISYDQSNILFETFLQLSQLCKQCNISHNLKVVFLYDHEILKFNKTELDLIKKKSEDNFNIKKKEIFKLKIIYENNSLSTENSIPCYNINKLFSKIEMYETTFETCVLIQKYIAKL